ncbi:hypothetical protein [Nocardia sp. R7R-8]|uniref:hypothetical protein n=1 Tax=Nocardia sp. R7R-8 TaxID=3459304 RepID=UPI00403D6C63
MDIAPDLQRYAITKLIGGQQHAGWIDAAGAFTDITAGESNQPCTATRNFQALGFHGNCDFYYQSVTPDNAYQIYRVPAGATSGGHMVTQCGAFSTVTYIRTGEGGIVPIGCGQAGQRPVVCSPVGTGDAAWISPTTYVAIHDTQLVRATTSDPLCYNEVGESAPLLPATNTTVVDKPMVSPDGTRVAFFYGGDIYTVATDGSAHPAKTNCPPGAISTLHLRPMELTPLMALPPRREDRRRRVHPAPTPLYSGGHNNSCAAAAKSAAFCLRSAGACPVPDLKASTPGTVLAIVHSS